MATGTRSEKLNEVTPVAGHANHESSNSSNTPAAAAAEPQSSQQLDLASEKPLHEDELVAGGGGGGGDGDYKVDSHDDILRGPNGEEYPSADELATLRHVKGRIDPLMYSIAIIEVCERFAYYGTTTVFTNYINFKRPEGSRTGAGYSGQSGALGYGQQAATGITLFNSFWSYVMPMLGGYLADTYWGKYHTINVGIACATVGHILITVSAIPTVLDNGSGAIAAFILGVLIFGVGVGFFKVNVSPLIAEQYEARHPRATIKTLKSGERVVEDPHMTYSIIYMRFYFCINVGAVVGQISMVYAEKYVGFWLAFLLPTILFLLCPIIMVVCRNKYVRNPPTGSVLGKSVGLLTMAWKKRWSWNPSQLRENFRRPGFWDDVKPSRLGDAKPHWMTFDDAWVDEVRRGFKACKVFIYYPIYWLPYNQIYNNLTAQAAMMDLGGVPNDVINNLDPIALLIFIPIFDKFIYPALARWHIRFTPIRKITAGFVLGTLAMITATVIQLYIYRESPCGYYAVECETPPPMTVWIQTPAYVLIAFSEIFASITGLEYAFTKAPKNMRGLVTGVFWLSQAISAALGQAFVPLAKDPHQVWLYASVTIIAALGGTGFWLTFRGLDREEEELNALPDGAFEGKRNEGRLDVEAVERAQAEQERLRHAQGLDTHPRE